MICELYDFGLFADIVIYIKGVCNILHNFTGL